MGLRHRAGTLRKVLSTELYVDPSDSDSSNSVHDRGIEIDRQLHEGISPHPRLRRGIRQASSVEIDQGII